MLFGRIFSSVIINANPTQSDLHYKLREKSGHISHLFPVQYIQVAHLAYILASKLQTHQSQPV